MKFKIGEKVKIKRISSDGFVEAIICTTFTVNGYDYKKWEFDTDGVYILKSDKYDEWFHTCNGKVKGWHGLYVPEDILKSVSIKKSKIIKK